VLLDSIAKHPQIAMLALQHRWAAPRPRLKTLWCKLATETPSWTALADVSSAWLKRVTGKAWSRAQARPDSR
jgi:hypothetical protein